MPVVAFDAAAGNRFVILLYADSDGGPIKTMVLPFGS
jgi:hypothetical protein